MLLGNQVAEIYSNPRWVWRFLEVSVATVPGKRTQKGTKSTVLVSKGTYQDNVPRRRRSHTLQGYGKRGKTERMLHPPVRTINQRLRIKVRENIIKEF